MGLAAGGHTHHPGGAANVLDPHWVALGVLVVTLHSCVSRRYRWGGRARWAQGVAPWCKQLQAACTYLEITTRALQRRRREVKTILSLAGHFDAKS